MAADDRMAQAQVGRGPVRPKASNARIMAKGGKDIGMARKLIGGDLRLPYQPPLSPVTLGPFASPRGDILSSLNKGLTHGSQLGTRRAPRLATKVGKMVVGSGLNGPTDQGPLINQAALRKVVEHVEDALAGGGKVPTGGRPIDGVGHFHAPTVIANVRRDALLCREETFGPVAGLIRFSNESEAIAMANDTEAGLAAYMFTRDIDRAARVSEALRYGMVGLNTGLISTEVAPFGGVKESGLGREGSHLGLEDYLDIKLVCRLVGMVA